MYAKKPYDRAEQIKSVRRILMARKGICEEEELITALAMLILRYMKGKEKRDIVSGYAGPAPMQWIHIKRDIASRKLKFQSLISDATDALVAAKQLYNVVTFHEGKQSKHYYCVHDRQIGLVVLGSKE